MSTINDRVKDWLKSAEKPSLCNNSKPTNHTKKFDSDSKEAMSKENRINGVMVNEFRDKRYLSYAIIYLKY